MFDFRICLTSKCKSKKVMVQGLILICLIGFSIIYYLPIHLRQREGDKTFHDTNLINLDKLASEVYYQKHCFDGKFEPRIDKLSNNLEVWSKAYNRKCQVLWKKFQTIFRIETKEGKLIFPKEFASKVRHWLNDNEELFSDIHNQAVNHIHNRYTREHTVYNVLRSRRPLPVPEEDPKKYIYKLASKTKPSCDFCHYKTMTAQDLPNRIESTYSASAANAFKLDKWHGLFLTKKHNPLEVKEEELVDLFNTSLKWFKSIHSLDEAARFPMLLWDTLPHAGASQFHPHVHGILGEHHYYGAFESQHMAAKMYQDEMSNEYWQDLIEIHLALGLTVRLGKAVAIVPLSSVKDHEVLLLSSTPCIDLFRLLYYVVHTYHTSLSKFCFSSGMAFPVMGPESARIHGESLPAFIRIGTRGDCTSRTSDISSLELYFMYNINTDPYVTISKLQDTVEQLSDSSFLKYEEMLELYNNLSY